MAAPAQGGDCRDECDRQSSLKQAHWEAGLRSRRVGRCRGNSRCKGVEVGNAPMLDGPQTEGDRDRVVWEEVGGLGSL